MAKIQEIGPYSAYAIAVKYGYKGTEEEWVKEQEENREASEAAAAAAAQSAKDAAASASSVAQSGQQAVQSIKDAQTAAEQAIDTAKQDAVQAAQAEAEKAATSAGQAASSAAEAAQSATNAAAEVGKVQNAGTAAVQAVQAAQNTATEAVSAAQQTATQTVSEAQATAVSAVQAEGTSQTSAVESAGTAAVADVSNAKTEALSQISAAGTAQVSAVGTAGADAVEDVNDAKTAALEAIDDANAALPSPTQSDAGKVPTVKTDGSAYELAGPYAPLSAAIRPTASGNPVSIADSVEWPLQGLKVYGKSTQDGTPSPENPVPIVSAGDGGQVEMTVCGANFFDSSLIPTQTQNGVSCTVLDDGSIYLNGTASAYAVFTTYIEAKNYVRLPQTFLTVSIHGSGSSSEGVYALFRLRKDNAVVAGFATPNSQTIDISGIDYDALQLGIQVEPGKSVNGNFKIMANVGQNPAPWSPYSGFQSLTLSTPNGLPGIPVNSGGNYTDATGQQWVCDEIDYARGVYVQRVKLFEVTSEINIGSLRRFNTVTFDGGYWPFRVYEWEGEIIKNSIAMCNNFQFGHTWQAKAELFYTTETTIDFNIEFSRIGVTSESNDEDAVNKVKQWISENPMFCLCQLVIPIETPLSDEELAAYRALHTYDGATVVSTAEDVAGLEVRYVADAQKYIDNRLTAAESRIQEIAAAQLNAQTGG